MQPLDFSHRTRQENIQRLQRETFDVLVIGGGITGAGIARDAALRGLSVALVEKNDYASGTSSKSSKLIHGGMRYLENLECGLVFEASQERRVLRKLAPHLVKPLPFIMPVYRGGSRPYWLIRAGMWLYDILALFRNVKMHRMLSAPKVVKQEPMVGRAGLIGGAQFYDCSVDDARLTLATILSAARAGAVAVNYLAVESLLKDKGRIVGVRGRDVLGGACCDVQARIVISAAGPWTDAILQMDEPQTAKRLRPTKGIHIVIRRERVKNKNAVAFAAIDRRLMFLIPWGQFSIIGTTDSDYRGDLDAVPTESSDVAYVLDSFNGAFPDAHLTHADIISTYAGLRPLVRQDVASSYKVSREHQVFETRSGLLAIAGGKLTTYRVMARQIVDAAEARLKEQGIESRRQGKSGKLQLEGAPAKGVRIGLIKEIEKACEAHRLNWDVAAHLLNAYGIYYARVLDLIAADASLGARLVPDLAYLKAEVIYAARHEMAMTLCDFLARRTHILNEDRAQGLECAPVVAKMMGQELGWSAEEMERQMEMYRRQVELTRQWQR